MIGSVTNPAPALNSGSARVVADVDRVSSCSAARLYPSPGTRTASTATQISFQGISASRVAGTDISIVGSVTGQHPGHLVADSTGRGASFYPNRPFAPGELVTVTTGLHICGGTNGTATFRIAEAAPLGPAPAPVPPLTPSPAVESFRSAPTIKPPALVVTKPAGPSAEGDFFLSPDPAAGGQAGQAGPMIVDGNGDLVWFDPLQAGELAADFRTQTYRGNTVLTWFQGQYLDGHGSGEFLIANHHYQVVRVVRAAEGYSADLHDFLLGSQETAWIVIYNTIGWNLSAEGGPADGAVYDSVVQELDLRTGNVLFEWHSLDHVSLASSYIPYVKAQTTPWDYFHLNSIDPLENGTVLISARDTEAAYLVDEATGRVLWTLGGKSSSFYMGRGAQFALQHDVELHGDATVTLFDDEDTTGSGPPARAIELRLNFTRHTASLVWVRQLPGYLLVLNQGNVQLLPDGNVIVGWGAGGYTTEFDPRGKILFNAHFPGLTSSYRAYRDPWSGQPDSPPAVATASGADGSLKVYASWNGSTDVLGWRVVGGGSPSDLATVASARRQGFQTTISLTLHPDFIKVEALGKGGSVLASSPVVATN